ncbi:hypothetical protein [Enterobacter ludwigii]
MKMTIIINNFYYTVYEYYVNVSTSNLTNFSGAKCYFIDDVLAMDEAEFFQEETVDPHIYIVRELIKLKDKLT